jgi:hypothetical protein
MAWTSTPTRSTTSLSMVFLAPIRAGRASCYPGVSAATHRVNRLPGWASASVVPRGTTPGGLHADREGVSEISRDRFLLPNGRARRRVGSARVEFSGVRSPRQSIMGDGCGDGPERGSDRSWRHGIEKQRRISAQPSGRPRCLGSVVPRGRREPVALPWNRQRQPRS